MVTDNFNGEGFTDPEFDMWLAGKLKDDVALPPKDFTKKMTELVCAKQEHKTIEPGFLILVAIFSMFLVIWIIIAFLLPSEIIEKTSLSLIYDWIGDINSILNIGNLILITGAGFFGIDMILNKYLTGKDIIPV